MADPLTMKLEQFTELSEETRGRIGELAAGRHKSWAPRQDILREGENPQDIHLVVSGMAARYKDLPGGERQYLAFLIPGDLCDVEVFVLDQMDHGIMAMSETTCALVSADRMRELLTEMSDLTQGLWWSTMTDAAVLRERIIDHGRRDAYERLAHLFYEMLIRFRMIGLAVDNSYPFPLTQNELAEATGLTPVHINRVLQQMRGDGLIEFRGKILTVTDPAALKRASRFSSRYLHLRRAAHDRDGDGVAERVSDLI